MRPAALTIAGSDPSGGAGLQADLKTFHQLGVYGTAAVTLLTVQNTTSVSRVEHVDPILIRQQVEAVLEDIPPAAIKIGAIGTVGAVRELARIHYPCPLILDPVMVGKHGSALLDPDGIKALIDLLIPKATLLTPNVEEASRLTGFQIGDEQEMMRAAEVLSKMGAAAILLKGGHLEGDAVDYLLLNGAFTELRARRVATKHTHGTGCTLSAAITAYTALGQPLSQSTANAKNFITRAIETAPGLGRGQGPVNHWAL